MSFTAGLIVLMVLAIVAGFLIGALIFSHDKDGTMYFWTDVRDGKVYTQMQLNETDIHEVAKKKYITLDCVEVPPLRDEDLVSSQENQGI